MQYIKVLGILVQKRCNYAPERKAEYTGGPQARAYLERKNPCRHGISNVCWQGTRRVAPSHLAVCARLGDDHVNSCGACYICR